MDFDKAGCLAWLRYSHPVCIADSWFVMLEHCRVAIQNMQR